MSSAGGATKRSRSASACLVVLIGVLFPSCLSCSSPAAAPSEAIATPPAAPSGSRQAVTSPIALPDDVLFVGRWTQPSTLLERMGTWLSGDASLELWLRGRLGRSRSPVELDEPIEVMVALDRAGDGLGLAWALSLALEGGHAWQKTSLEPLDVPSPVGLHCAEAPALGSAERRLVCAPSADALGRLLPVATRALPLVVLPGDEVSFTFRTRQLERIGRSELERLIVSGLEAAVGILPTKSDFTSQLSAIASASELELDALAADLDGISASLSSGDEGMAFELRLPGETRSSLFRLLLGGAGRGPAPPHFWQLARGADDAAFLWSMEPAPLAAMRGPLAALLARLLDFRGVPDRLGSQARSLLETLPLPQGPVVYASGHLRPAGSENASGEGLSDLGWGRYRVRGRLGEYRSYVGELVRTFEDPILGSQMGRLLRTSLGKRWVPTRIRQRGVKPRRRLPRDSFVVEIAFADLASPSFSEANHLHAIFVPDGDGVQIAWGADESQLVSLIARGLQQPGRAAPPTGLRWLSRGDVMAGGFHGLASAGQRVARLFGAAAPGFERAWGLEAAPHRGMSPIVYVLEPGEEAFGARLVAHLEPSTIEDLAFVLAK